MSEAPTYATSSDAYRAIHAALGDWIGGMINENDFLKESDWREVIYLAGLMREIEEHTDVE